MEIYAVKMIYLKIKMRINVYFYEVSVSFSVKYLKILRIIDGGSKFD